MLEDLLASLNAMLVQHPHLLHVMRILFWVKYWLLLAIFGVFVYLAHTDESLRTGARKRPSPRDKLAA